MKKCIVWALLLILLCGAGVTANAELEKYHTTVFHTPRYSVDYDYFLVDDGNYMLTLRDIENATSFCWYRM